MKAAVIDDYGTLDVLHVRDVPRPALKPDEVLIEVIAAAVNPIDGKIRDGTMRFRFGRNFPMVLGFDMSGTIAEVGSQVTRFKIGDVVYARSDRKTGEACAEFCAVGAHCVAPKPEQLSHEEAAAIPLAALTALQALRDDAGMRSGDRALIIGASGGVGTYGVQIAKAMGAEVTAVCSTANLPLVKELGADHLIDYTQEDPLKADRPYDVVYDAVGTQTFEKARTILTPTGSYICTVPSFTTVAGRFLLNRFRKQKAVFNMVKPSGTDLALINNWVQEGKLRSVIDSRFSLADIRDAHARSETQRARGKIVVQVQEQPSAGA